MTRRLLSKPIHAKESNDPPSANQGFLQLSPVEAMLSHPMLKPTHPPVLPFALVQNPSPKDIARSDIIS